MDIYPTPWVAEKCHANSLFEYQVLSADQGGAATILFQSSGPRARETAAVICQAPAMHNACKAIDEAYRRLTDEQRDALPAELVQAIGFAQASVQHVITIDNILRPSIREVIQKGMWAGCARKA